MEILDLAKAINRETGKELEAATFLTAAVLADLVGKKEIGDYYQRRMNEILAGIQKQKALKNKIPSRGWHPWKGQN
ncbi:MAG: hypothetical protein CSYNP_03646 [Syntrophus sp. SKADARSKE-3]|nr:hypothetical protein [Syntrophus sp. SKADARSKE-3]